MAEPTEYRVLRALQAALQAITVGGGYFYTLQAAAVKLDRNVDVEDLVSADGPRPFAVLEVTPETWEYYPASEVRLALPVTIHWVHDVQDPTDALVGEPTPPGDEQRQRLFWRGCADVERAIGVDASLGGLVTDTRIVRRTLESDVDSQLLEALIEIVITLRRTYGQP